MLSWLFKDRVSVEVVANKGKPKSVDKVPSEYVALNESQQAITELRKVHYGKLRLNL